MLLYVVLITQIKVIDMEMISECPIITKGKLILDLLVLELGVVDQRDDKEVGKLYLLPNYYFIYKYNKFEVLGVCVYAFLDLVDTPLISLSKFSFPIWHISKDLYIWKYWSLVFLFFDI